MKVAFCFCALLLIAACVPVTTKEQVWKDVPATAEGQAKATDDLRLLIGDTARVGTKQGKQHTFRVYKIDPDGFHGTAKDNKNYRIAYDTLVFMQVLRTETNHELIPLFPAIPIGGPVSSTSSSSYGGGGGLGLGLLCVLSVAGLARHKAALVSG